MYTYDEIFDIALGILDIESGGLTLKVFIECWG